MSDEIPCTVKTENYKLQLKLVHIKTKSYSMGEYINVNVVLECVSDIVTF
jgi:hypothetical protein